MLFVVCYSLCVVGGGLSVVASCLWFVVGGCAFCDFIGYCVLFLSCVLFKSR